MVEKENVAAVILAAGLSSRMGTLKPLLPFGRETALERTICAFREAGIQKVKVVSGHHAEQVKRVTDKMDVICVVNEQYRSGMLSSVQKGIEGLVDLADAFFLLPVDYPMVQASTMELIYQGYRKIGKGIAYPVFRGTRGHPPLISCDYVQGILNWQGPEGLRGFLQRHDKDAVSIQVSDQSVLLDMDVPDDYKRLLRLMEQHNGI